MTGTPSPCHRGGEIVATPPVPITHPRLGRPWGPPESLAPSWGESQGPQNLLPHTEQSPLPPELRPILGEPPPAGVPLDPVVSLFLRREQRQQRRERDSSPAQRLRRFLRRKLFLFRRRSVPNPAVPCPRRAPPLVPPCPPLSPQCPDDADRAAEPGAGPPVPGAPGTGGGLCQLARGGGRGSARERRGGPEGPRALNFPNKRCFRRQKCSRASVSPHPPCPFPPGLSSACAHFPSHPTSPSLFSQISPNTHFPPGISVPPPQDPVPQFSHTHFFPCTPISPSPRASISRIFQLPLHPVSPTHSRWLRLTHRFY